MGCPEKAAEQAVAATTTTAAASATSSKRFDCRADLGRWATKWTVAKVLWCCKHERRGCPRPTLPTTTARPYDCEADQDNWQRAWSSGKKQWCCEHLRLGCSAVAKMASTSVKPIPLSTTFVKYDCQADPRRQGGATWPPEKTEWCCRQAKVGCPSTGITTTAAAPTLPAIADPELAAAAAAAAAQRQRRRSGKEEAAPAQAAAAEGPGSGQPSKKPFDCQAGLENWKEGFVSGGTKADWCCRHEQLWCPTPVPPSAGQGKRTPYNCLTEYAHWETGWSVVKKDYCCRLEGRGCPTTSTRNHDEGVEEAEEPAPAWDCQEGVEDWETGWVVAKAKWCCAHYKVGCLDGPGPPDRDAAPPSTRTTTTEAPFNCRVGLLSWEWGWSTMKKEWCCRRYELGCQDEEEAPLAGKFQRLQQRMVGFMHGGAAPQVPRLSRRLREHWAVACVGGVALVATLLTAVVAGVGGRCARPRRALSGDYQSLETRGLATVGLSPALVAAHLTTVQLTREDRLLKEQERENGLNWEEDEEDDEGEGVRARLEPARLRALPSVSAQVSRG